MVCNLDEASYAVSQLFGFCNYRKYASNTQTPVHWVRDTVAGELVHMLMQFTVTFEPVAFVHCAWDSPQGQKRDLHTCTYIHTRIYYF